MENTTLENRQLIAFYEDFVKLRDVVYNWHPAGGELHITLDDHNVEDSHLAFCNDQIKYTNDEDSPYWVKIAMLAIISMLSEMDVETRTLFVEDGVYDKVYGNQ